MFLYLLTMATTSLMQGPVFSAAIMTILTAHEFGHYFVARYHGVKPSLPYFIPTIFLFGTMGAVIRLKSAIPNRRILFDFSIAGPLAGFIFAVPISLYGLATSSMVPTSHFGTGRIVFSESLLFKAMIWLTHGSIPASQTVSINEMALAGWTGLFMTALNLLPIGQLDGGHIAYAVLGRKRSHILGSVTLAALIGSTFYTQKYTYVLLAIALLFFGMKHPKTKSEEHSIGRVRIVLSFLAGLIFMTTFTLTPIAIAGIGILHSMLGTALPRFNPRLSISA